jgi:hypothetical protein
MTAPSFCPADLKLSDDESAEEEPALESALGVGLSGITPESDAPLTLRAEAEAHGEDTTNYLKFANGSAGPTTGRQLNVNECDKRLGVIDIDFHENLDPCVRHVVITDTIEALENKGAVLVETTSGGIHIYAINDLKFKTNRSVKAIKAESYGVDIFAVVDAGNHSPVMLPDSKAKNDEGAIAEYHFHDGYSWDSVITAKMSEVLELLDLKLEQEKPKPKPAAKAAAAPNDNEEAEAKQKKAEEPLTVERFKLIYEGLKGLEIHNYAAKSDDEISLLPLFSALNACRKYVGDEEVESATEWIYQNGNLTKNASRNWETTKAKVNAENSAGYFLRIRS